jgi:hypothetical protein
MTEQVTVVKKDNAVTVVEKTNTVTVASKGTQGVQGPAGAAGAQGLQGPAGTGGSFVFEQQSNSTTWTIIHNLQYRPAVTIQDYSKNTIEGDINHIDISTVQLLFAEPVSGYAYLS